MHVTLKKLTAASLGGLVIAALSCVGGEESPLLCPAEAEGKKWKYYGSSTCAGSSCHGASKPEDKRPADEYKTWQGKDRHAKAYGTLFEQWSLDIVAYYNSEGLGEEIKDASTDKRCLECHSTNAPKDLHGEKYTVEDGVSCDGCHGPAEGWFEPHTKEHKYEDMLELGMWDTRDMWKRADTCVLCHLQIDPELVLAGHPDLSFELVAASNREPPHWYERQTWDGVRAWTVGTAVSIRECLLKLKKRVDREKKNEDNIFVAAAQTTSYLNVFRHAVATFGTDAEKELSKKLDGLLNAEKLDHAALSTACAEGAKAMDEMAKRLAKSKDAFSKEVIKKLWDTICADKVVLEGIDEFGAEQVAGALYALHSSYSVGAGPRGKDPMTPPAEIQALFVRPTVFGPEDLFDADGYFKSKEWNGRLKKASALVK